MKYLRSLKYNSIIEDVNDICLELADNGLQVVIDDNQGIISISINRKNGEIFEYNDVRDVIERLKFYLGDKIESIMIGSINIDEEEYIWNELNPGNDIYYLDDVYAIEIEFEI